MAVLPAEAAKFEYAVPVVVIGAGACGLTAALAVREVRHGGAGARAGRQARRQHRALDRPHPRRRYALPARARHRGFAGAPRRGHLAQGEGRDGPRGRRRRRAGLGTDDRVARRPPRRRVQARRGLPLPGPLGAAHARDAAPHRRGARGRAARRRGTARHRHRGERDGDRSLRTWRRPRGRSALCPPGRLRRKPSGAMRSSSRAAVSAATGRWSASRSRRSPTPSSGGTSATRATRSSGASRSAQPSPTSAATRVTARSPRPTATRSTGDY